MRQANEAKYRAIFDTVGDAIVVSDDRGIIVSFNPAAEKAVGYADDEIVGRNGIDLAWEISLRYSGMPVLLATGYSEAAIDAEAKGLTIVRKPYSPLAVVGVIAETLRRGSIRSAAPDG